MVDFEFNCDDCGKPWSLKVQRAGPHYCKECIEKRRKLGTGPIQQKRTDGTLGAPSTVSTTSTATRVPRAPKGSPAPEEDASISELASRLRGKYGTGTGDDGSEDQETSVETSVDGSEESEESDDGETVEAIGESL